MPEIRIDERGERESVLGRVLQLKVWAPGYPLLAWTDVCTAFNERYPGWWAVQVFPPAGDVVDSKNVYHLWATETEPMGLNLRRQHP